MRDITININTLRYSSFIEVKIPIDQADALPFQDRIKKPLGINEFRGDAPSHIDSPARRKAFLRISEIVARTESEDHRKDRCQEDETKAKQNAVAEFLRQFDVHEQVDDHDRKSQNRGQGVQDRRDRIAVLRVTGNPAADDSRDDRSCHQDPVKLCLPGDPVGAVIAVDRNQRFPALNACFVKNFPSGDECQEVPDRPSHHKTHYETEKSHCCCCFIHSYFLPGASSRRFLIVLCTAHGPFRGPPRRLFFRFPAGSSLLTQVGEIIHAE